MSDDGRVLAALEVLGWPDDRERSAHVEEDGHEVTPAGHYWSIVCDVLAAADLAAELVERSDLPEGQHTNASDLESPAPTFKESAETLNKRGEAAQQSLSRGARALRYPEDSPRFDFWLLAEPPYDLFDDLHAARIERALDDFEARVRAQTAEDLRAYASNYPAEVFPPDSDVRDAIAGTAMRHAYNNAARLVEKSGKAFPSLPAALPDVVGTPTHPEARDAD